MPPTRTPSNAEDVVLADMPRQSSNLSNAELTNSSTVGDKDSGPNRQSTVEERGRNVADQYENRSNRSGEGKIYILDDITTYTKDFWIIPMPRRARYNPKEPFCFGIALKILFGFASTFTVANVYYCQPLLVQLSESFNVSYSQVSNIPTLVQAGYALGLLFITPLGDLVRRRPLILSLITLSTLLTVPLSLTPSLPAFSTFTFLTGVVSVTPMVLVPLAADLALPHRRASAIAVVFSGLLLGILIARVLAGVVAQYAPWRVVYGLAIGVQGAVLLGCWTLLPDYPAARANRGLGYREILWTMGRYTVKEPLVFQAALVNMGSNACFTNFWVTLTFLLAGPPYHYTTLAIGLFGLVGIFGVILGPVVGRLIDHLNPWHASLISIVLHSAFQTVQVAAGGIHIVAPVITAFALDVFRAMLQVSLTTAVFNIAPEARSRLNAILVLSLFIGQVIGTAVGTRVFLQYGWRASALLSLGWYGWQLAVMLSRGPHCARTTWVGWEGSLGGVGKVMERDRRVDGVEDGVPSSKNFE